MKKNHFILGYAIVGLVSYLCIKGMKAVDKKIENDKKKS